MFVEKVDSDTLERETVNHTFLDHVFAPSIKEGVGRTTGLVFVNTVSLPDCQEENEWVRVWCLYYCLVQEQLCNLLFT